MRHGAHHWVAALGKSPGNPRRYWPYAQRHYRQAASDAAIASEELPQECGQGFGAGITPAEVGTTGRDGRLHVPPGLSAADSQEIKPASGALASIGIGKDIFRTLGDA
jgi:hypothetical protein